ncbi:unnamed protein product, partial [Amoebophrya sp. A25]|eukprot:GSA25T00025731001.1
MEEINYATAAAHGSVSLVTPRDRETTNRSEEVESRSRTRKEVHENTNWGYGADRGKKSILGRETTQQPNG